MAELYLDDDARRASNIRSLIAASKPKTTTPTAKTPAKTDAQKDA